MMYLNQSDRIYSVFSFYLCKEIPPELFWRGETTCPRTHFHIHLWDIYLRLWDQNSNMVSFCVFTFLMLKVFSTFTLQKNRRKVLGVQGSRAHQDASFEHHAGSVGPSNVWVFCSFLRKEALQYFWCLPIIFRAYPRNFWPKSRARQRATFMFLIHFWASWKTHLKICQKHFKMFQSAEHAKFAPGARILHVHSRPGTGLGWVFKCFFKCF